MALVVGVDSSTSSCKIQVRDADTGVLVAEGRAPHPPTTPPRSEQHPRDWRNAFEAACAEAGVPDRHRPDAVAVAGQQHGLVVLDAVSRVGSMPASAPATASASTPRSPPPAHSDSTTAWTRGAIGCSGSATKL